MNIIVIKIVKTTMIANGASDPKYIAASIRIRTNPRTQPPALISKKGVYNVSVILHEKLFDSISYQNGSIVSKQIIKKTNGNITLFAFDKNDPEKYDFAICYIAIHKLGY